MNGSPDREERTDPMELVIYGDFNCPYSCLASARADVLAERGVAEVTWRAVEHDPTMPVPSRPVEGDLAAMLDREVDEVRSLLRPGEVFPIQRPPVHPNSAAAIAAFAGADPKRIHERRRRLFAALWFEGRDLADRDELDRLATDRHTDDQEARAARVDAWRLAWQGLDVGVVPVLVLADGTVVGGLEALEQLAELSRSTT